MVAHTESPLVWVINNPSVCDLGDLGQPLRGQRFFDGRKRHRDPVILDAVNLSRHQASGRCATHPSNSHQTPGRKHPSLSHPLQGYAHLRFEQPNCWAATPPTPWSVGRIETWPRRACRDGFPLQCNKQEQHQCTCTQRQLRAAFVHWDGLVHAQKVRVGVRGQI